MGAKPGEDVDAEEELVDAERRHRDHPRVDPPLPVVPLKVVPTEYPESGANRIP